MIRDLSKHYMGTAHYFRAAVHCLGVCLFSAVLLTGCSTIATYKPQAAAGPAKPPGYPVLVYTEDMTVPRPCEVIGTISVSDTYFTMFGGSIESEMGKVMHAAREKGADVVQMKSMGRPDFSDTHYRLVADLLRYKNAWETVVIPEQAFANYLKTNQRNLDPIEGVWDGSGRIPHRIGIIKDTSKAGRHFIGFVLNTENPTWRKGYKKIDIQRGLQPGSYIFDYYLDDFSKRETTVVLGGRMTFTLAIPVSEEQTELITYSKERQVSN